MGLAFHLQIAKREQTRQVEEILCKMYHTQSLKEGPFEGLLQTANSGVWLVSKRGDGECV